MTEARIVLKDKSGKNACTWNLQKFVPVVAMYEGYNWATVITDLDTDPPMSNGMFLTGPRRLFRRTNECIFGWDDVTVSIVYKEI